MMMAPFFGEPISLFPGVVAAVEIVAKATLVLVAAGAIALAMGRRSAAARHLVWCMGLCAALALPVLCLLLPGWSWQVLPLRAASTRASQPAGGLAAAGSKGQGSDWPSSGEVVSDMDERLSMEVGAGRFATRSGAGGSPSPATLSSSLMTPSWSWLWAGWFAGVVCLLSRMVAGLLARQRWSRGARPIVGDEWSALLNELCGRLGLSRRVRLLVIDSAAMPMTWGSIWPVVLLPGEAVSWSIDRRRDVLLHELAHVRRLDCFTQMLAGIACAIYWFHPLAWLAERRVRIERERACDDVVLLAGSRATDYADHLLRIARGLRSPRVVALAALSMARPSQLEGRLKAILDPARRRGGPGRARSAIAIGVVILLVVLLSALHLGGRRAAGSQGAEVGGAQAASAPSAQMTVTGRVLDPSGKPVPEAAVMVILRSKYARRPLLEWAAVGALSAYEGRCDAEGQFRITMPRSSSARDHGLTLTALAPGFGVGWIELDTDADSMVADVSLKPELLVAGRMFDVNGEPARGVAVRISALTPVQRGSALASMLRPDFDEPVWRALPAWPGPALSDEQGRFTLHGLCRDLLCRLNVEDPRYAIPLTTLQTAPNLSDQRAIALFTPIQVDLGPDPRPITLTLDPARTLVGRVTYADTGRAVPGAMVASGARFQQAEGEGRFRLFAGPSRNNRFAIRAHAPDGPPYLVAFKQGEWGPGEVEKSVDVALPRGVVVRGKVTEEGNGRPVVGAVVRVTPFGSLKGPATSSGVPGLTGADGSYRVAAPPGPGHVVVQGPDDNYVLKEFIAGGAIYTAGPGRRRLYAQAYRAVDLKPGDADHEVDLSLRRGAAVRGQVVGPDGQPVREGWVCSRQQLRTQADGGWKIMLAMSENDFKPIHDGRFVLHGLDPGSEAEIPAFFLDGKRKLGAVARFSGRSAANGPVTVRLEPCGRVRCRLLSGDGKPLERYPAIALATMVITPGPIQQRGQAQDGPPYADQAVVAQLDPANYHTGLQSDAQGRLTFPALIPGATYRIVDSTPDDGSVIRKEFIVKPGEELDLGDILIASPRGQN
jgi:beta-lactamase regulating signal transducer with metallopeptidase domain